MRGIKHARTKAVHQRGTLACQPNLVRCGWCAGNMLHAPRRRIVRLSRVYANSPQVVSTQRHAHPRLHEVVRRHLRAPYRRTPSEAGRQAFASIATRLAANPFVWMPDAALARVRSSWRVVFRTALSSVCRQSRAARLAVACGMQTMARRRTRCCCVAISSTSGNSPPPPNCAARTGSCCIEPVAEARGIYCGAGMPIRCCRRSSPWRRARIAQQLAHLYARRICRGVARLRRRAAAQTVGRAIAAHAVQGQVFRCRSCLVVPGRGR